MIIGIGTDIVDIRRIERALETHGVRFEERLFTAEEQAKARRRVNPAYTYAKRFAAKEAMSKALGTGIKKGVFFKDMGVMNLPSGQPTMRLTGGALLRFEAVVPSGMRGAIHLALTDDYPYAQAFVVIEATERSN